MTVRLDPVLPLAALLAAGGALACTARTADDVVLDEAGLELGSGSWRFEPLEDGQTVDMVRGAQGGWHVWVSIRADGFESDEATLVLESQLADDSRPAQITEVDVHLERPDDEGRRLFVGWPEVLADPGCIADRMVRLQATLRDAAGTRADALVYVRVMGGDDPPPACETEG